MIVVIIGFEKHLSTELCKTRIISLYMKKWSKKYEKTFCYENNKKMFFEIKFKGRHTFSQKDTWFPDKQL